MINAANVLREYGVASGVLINLRDDNHEDVGKKHSTIDDLDWLLLSGPKNPQPPWNEQPADSTVEEVVAEWVRCTAPRDARDLSKTVPRPVFKTKDHVVLAKLVHDSMNAALGAFPQQLPDLRNFVVHILQAMRRALTQLDEQFPKGVDASASTPSGNCVGVASSSSLPKSKSKKKRNTPPASLESAASFPMRTADRGQWIRCFTAKLELVDPNCSADKSVVPNHGVSEDVVDVQKMLIRTAVSIRIAREVLIAEWLLLLGCVLPPWTETSAPPGRRTFLAPQAERLRGNSRSRTNKQPEEQTSMSNRWSWLVGDKQDLLAPEFATDEAKKFFDTLFSSSSNIRHRDQTGTSGDQENQVHEENQCPPVTSTPRKPPVSTSSLVDKQTDLLSLLVDLSEESLEKEFKRLESLEEEQSDLHAGAAKVRTVLFARARGFLSELYERTQKVIPHSVH